MCVFVFLTGSEDCGNRRDSEATDRCDLSAVKYRIIITGILSYSLILTFVVLTWMESFYFTKVSS